MSEQYEIDIDSGIQMQNILTQYMKCLIEIKNLSIEIQGIRKMLELIFIAIIVCFGIVIFGG